MIKEETSLECINGWLFSKFIKQTNKPREGFFFSVLAIPQHMECPARDQTPAAVVTKAAAMATQDP